MTQSARPEQVTQPEAERNFNDHILVRVTEVGEQMWDEYHSEVRIALKDPTACPLERDEEGYTRLQLNQVAHIFGTQMYSGARPPIEMLFKFEK